MLATIKHKLISLLQLILVLIYIIFEELIWEGIAYPIYKYVHSLQILQKVEAKLHGVNRYVILVIFVLMLAGVEAFGLYAGYLFVSGNVLLGLAIYLGKIPVAAFTFWMFRVTEDKLMKFAWFKWLYERVMQFIDWLKSLDVYKSTLDRVTLWKEKFRAFRLKHFSKESPFVTKMKHFYRTIKASLRNKEDNDQ